MGDRPMRLSTAMRAMAAIVIVTVPMACGAVVVPSPSSSEGSASPGSHSPETPGAPTVAPGEAVRVDPAAIDFATPDHGWVSGSAGSPATGLVLETTDGGHSWTLGGLGPGTAPSVGGAGDLVLAGRACPEGAEACGARTFRAGEAGTWAGTDEALLIATDVVGSVGVVASVRQDAARDQTGFPAADLSVTTNGGATWTVASKSCRPDWHLVDVDLVDASTVVALCTTEGGTGNQDKELWRSTDGGVRWQRFARLDRGVGTLPMGSNPRLSLAPDGTGWMAGSRMPLYRTADGGASWAPVDLVDGEVRIANDASALPGGGGAALVWDPDRQATLLMRSTDGTHWDERFAWPAGG